MRPRLLPLAVLACALAPAGPRPAGAAPSVPGFLVQTYATVSGPAGLSFDASGNLFVGHDDSASGTVAIRRVPAGGGAAADYGAALPDPDGVLVDVDGSLSGKQGAVLVCGDAGGGEGQLVALVPGTAPDQNVKNLYAAVPSVLGNPNDMALGAGGLLLADAGKSGIFRFVSPGPPTELVASPSPPAHLAVDAGGHIYVSHDDGAIREYGPDGSVVKDPLVTGLGSDAPIAVAPGGAFGTDLYALDTSSGDLLRVAADGTTSVVGSGFPTKLGDMEFHQDGGADAEGALYVASFGDGEILRVAPIPPLDSFLCYRAKTSKGADAFTPRETSLGDALETRQVRVKKPKAICNPADQDGNGIGDANTHLESYAIQSAAPGAKHVGIPVSNVFGSLVLDTRKRGADRLLVPSALSLSGSPTPLGTTGVDPFACYEARRSPGSPPLPKHLQIALADAFDTTARTFDVGGPKHLCLPADLGTETAQRPDQLLVCYATRSAKDQLEPPTGIQVANEFGDEQLDTVAVPGKSASGGTLVTGTLQGGGNETTAGQAPPGTWSDLAGTPNWEGGGQAGSGDELVSSFTDTSSLPDGEVQEWRLFLEIDITENETDEGPGVAMTATGIPGIPDGTEVVAMASGKPRGLTAHSPFFSPPSGTTLADLSGAKLQFQPRSDGSVRNFGFEIEAWGVEYRVVASSDTSTSGQGAEEELCVPSTSP